MSTISQEGKASLRIAYIMAACDGIVKKEEIDVFMETLRVFKGEPLGDAETTGFILTVVEDARKLMYLRKFYTEEEMVKAVLFTVRDALQTLIYDGVRTLRRAFAVWLSVCLSDKDYSPIEKRIIKEIQRQCNASPICTSVEINQAISDEYLLEIESRLHAIDELRQQRKNPQPGVDGLSLEKSIETLVDSLKSFVDDVNH